MITLYHNDMSVCAQKVRLILTHKQLAWSSEHLNLREGEQHTAAFKKISPKAVVPVLVDDGHVVLESSVIVEYLDEAYPSLPVFPITHTSKAMARRWIIRLDAGLHGHIATISFCCAFKYQLLSKHPDQTSLNHFIGRIPDPERAALLKDTLQLDSLKSERLVHAVYAFNTLLNDMSNVLRDQDWLVGNEVGATDYSFIPYIDRLEQLGLAPWWNTKPGIDQWLLRVRQTPAYHSGINTWINQGYLDLMSKHADASWSAISSILNDM